MRLSPGAYSVQAPWAVHAKPTVERHAEYSIRPREGRCRKDQDRKGCQEARHAEVCDRYRHARETHPEPDGEG